MLYPLRWRHFAWTLFVQVADTHRKLQRESFHEATKTASTSRIFFSTRPTIHESLRGANGFLFVVHAFCHLFYTTTILITTRTTIVIPRDMKLMHDIIAQDFFWNWAAVIAEANIHPQPCEQ